MGKTHSEKCRARIYKAMDEEDDRIRKQREEPEDNERNRRRLDPSAQVSERSLADAGGSRKRQSEVPHEELDKERRERQEESQPSSSSKRPAEVPVEQADKERRDQVFREDGIRDSVASRGLGDVYKRQLLVQLFM